MLQKLVFLIFLGLFIYSCKKEESDTKELNKCAEEFIGSFSLQKDTRSILPYQNITTISFKNEGGNKVLFTFSEKFDGYIVGGVTILSVCKEDSSKQKIYKAKSEGFRYYVKSDQDSLGFSFIINIGTIFTDFTDSPEFSVSDVLYIERRSTVTKEDEITQLPGQIRILVNRGSLHDNYLNNFNLPVESVSILNKEFKNVFVAFDSTLFYNTEKGLVGFKDTLNSIWVYDTLYTTLL